MRLIALAILISTTVLLASAKYENCDPHTPQYHIDNPSDCLVLARRFRSRGNRPLRFKIIPQGMSPRPVEVPVPHVERYRSCEVDITVIRNEAVSSWYEIGEEIYSIYIQCRTTLEGYGGSGILGSLYRLFISMSKARGLPGLQKNETANSPTAEGGSASLLAKSVISVPTDLANSLNES